MNTTKLSFMPSSNQPSKLFNKPTNCEKNIMKSYKIVLLIYIFIFPTINAYDDDALDSARCGCRNLIRAELTYAPLYNRCLINRKMQNAYLISTMFNKSNLRKSDLSHAIAWGADFKDAKMQKTILYNIKANCAFFENANLTNANMREGNFSYAKFTKDTIFNNTKVENANFAHCKGLTNEQKEYLRANGAINVPINIYYEIEEDSPFIGKEEAVRQKINFFKRLGLYFYRKVRPIKKKDAQNQACAPFPKIVYELDNSGVGTELSKKETFFRKIFKKLFKRYKNTEMQSE